MKKINLTKENLDKARLIISAILIILALIGILITIIGGIMFSFQKFGAVGGLTASGIIIAFICSLGARSILPNDKNK